MLYVEYMSVSIFIAGIAHGDGNECEGAVDVRPVSADVAVAVLIVSNVVGFTVCFEDQCGTDCIRRGGCLLCDVGFYRCSHILTSTSTAFSLSLFVFCLSWIVSDTILSKTIALAADTHRSLERTATLWSWMVWDSRGTNLECGWRPSVCGLITSNVNPSKSF